MFSACPSEARIQMQIRLVLFGMGSPTRCLLSLDVNEYCMKEETSAMKKGAVREQC